jgi:RHS repeat-associated protein
MNFTRFRPGRWPANSPAITGSGPPKLGTLHPLFRLTCFLLLGPLLSSGLPPFLLVSALGAPGERKEPVPPPVLTPQNVVVNRMVPKVRLASEVEPLSEKPSEDELARVRLFPQRIIPVNPMVKSGFFSRAKPSTATEDSAPVVATLRKVQQSTNPHDTAHLQAFLGTHPKSRWAPSLRHELSRRQCAQGMFVQAIAGWESLWADLKDRREPEALGLADEVLARLLDAYTGMGNVEKLTGLIADAESRPPNGVIQAKLIRARHVAWLMQHNGAQNVMCGPFALYGILKAKGRTFAPISPDSITNDFIATGISLSQVKKYADGYGLDLVMARRTGSGPIPTPSVFHLAAGHYSALLAEKDGKYFMEDRALQFQGWVSLETIESQASGHFLIPAKPLPGGWQAVSEREGARVFGRFDSVPPEPSGQSNPRGSPNTDPDKDSDPCKGMPRFTFHPQTAALRVEDTPVGYKPPVGPAVSFTVAYLDVDDSKPASAPAFSNVGRMWSIDWVAYLDHVAGVLTDGSSLTVHLAGGGVEVSTYNSGSGTFGPSDRSFATVTRSGSATYTRTFPDGSKEIYDTSDNPATPSRVFLSQKVDPTGNALTLTYDTNMRLIAVADAIGQVTTFQYTNASDIYKIVKVTDPFGRFATLSYNAAGNLSTITDVLGLTSSFTYTGDQMTSMTTPYGVTTFAVQTDGGLRNRLIEATDPQGDKQRVQYVEPADVPVSGPALPASIDIAGTPVSFFANNTDLSYRNSYYWSKIAMKAAPGDVTKARIYRWFRGSYYTVTSVLEFIKEPFENPVWFNYPNQALGYYPGQGAEPEKTLRLLDDGTPQLSQAYYNALGQPTSVVDPLGRTTTYSYEPNQIDLREVRQKTGAATSERLAFFTYNSQHLPLTSTDVSGQTTLFSYNAKGQVLTVTNARNEVTTFNYDADGYLQFVDGPLPGPDDRTNFTYDGFGRVRTVTYPDGYSLTYDYDYMNRVTKVTCPDATYEQYIYDRLDLGTYRDRLGRQTIYTRNALRQLVQKQDPLLRITRYEWCRCGDLKKLIDPMGRATTWHHDVQGRAIDKEYADGSKVLYTYENTTSRLKQRVDEKGQITQFVYNIDGSLGQVNYANALVPTPSVSYTYDPLYMRHNSMTDGVGTTLYAYNAVSAVPGLGAGKLASVDGPWANDTITYSYDELGRVSSRSVNAVTQTMHHDPAGRMDSITNALGTFTSNYDGATRRLASVTHSGGLKTLFFYLPNNQDRRLSKIQNLKPDGVTLLSVFDYTYDVEGRIQIWKQQDDNASAAAKTWTIGYDNADQLTSAIVQQGGIAVKTSAWEYDMAGNRTKETTDGAATIFTYNSLNELNQMSSSVAAATYEWDAENHLTAISQGTARTEFSYDGLGRRVKIVEKTSGTVTSTATYLWDGHAICERRDTSGGSVQQRYFEQGFQGVSGSPTGVHIYTRDHLSSTRELADPGGVMKERISYDAWGQPQFSNATPLSSFAFTGHFWYARSGLYMAPYRAYAPTLGRWLSRDPIEESGGINLFVYVENSPVVRRDPLGLYGTSDCSYYEMKCLEEGGKYYCEWAKKYCNMFPKDNKTPYGRWALCVRQCLQACDKEHKPPRDSCPINPDPRTDDPWDPINRDCHAKCYTWCAHLLLGF